MKEGKEACPEIGAADMDGRLLESVEAGLKCIWEDGDNMGGP